MRNTMAVDDGRVRRGRTSRSGVVEVRSGVRFPGQIVRATQAARVAETRTKLIARSTQRLFLVGEVLWVRRFKRVGRPFVGGRVGGDMFRFRRRRGLRR